MLPRADLPAPAPGHQRSRCLRDRGHLPPHPRCRPSHARRGQRGGHGQANSLTGVAYSEHPVRLHERLGGEHGVAAAHDRPAGVPLVHDELVEVEQAVAEPLEVDLHGFQRHTPLVPRIEADLGLDQIDARLLKTSAGFDQHLPDRGPRYRPSGNRCDRRPAPCADAFPRLDRHLSELPPAGKIRSPRRSSSRDGPAAAIDVGAAPPLAPRARLNGWMPAPPPEPVREALRRSARRAQRHRSSPAETLRRNPGPIGRHWRRRRELRWA